MIWFTFRTCAATLVWIACQAGAAIHSLAASLLVEHRVAPTLSLNRFSRPDFALSPNTANVAS
jgi:hypothetical protein